MQCTWVLESATHIWISFQIGEEGMYDGHWWSKNGCEGWWLESPAKIQGKSGGRPLLGVVLARNQIGTVLARISSKFLPPHPLFHLSAHPPQLVSIVPINCCSTGTGTQSWLFLKMRIVLLQNKSAAAMTELKYRRIADMNQKLRDNYKFGPIRQIRLGNKNTTRGQHTLSMNLPWMPKLQ